MGAESNRAMRKNSRVEHLAVLARNLFKVDPCYCI